MTKLITHLKHGLTALVSLLVVTVPLVAADPGIRTLAHHELVRHPAVSAYIPIALVVVHAVSRALRDKRAAGNAPPAP